MGGGYRLGIDLGTTYVGAALHRDGRSEILSLGADRDVIPSVVYIGSDGNVLVGDAAARRAIAEPDRVARGFKRRVGDPTPIMVGGQPWSAQLLTAELIKSVVHAATEIEGARPEHVAICHPATWGAHKLEVYDAAATSAGLDERTFLSEPEAAAIFYAAADRIDVGRIVAVYDLGGGTFDATLLRRGENGFELLGKPIGIEDIGGMDFDDVVFNHVAELLGERLTSLDDTNPDALAAVEALRERCQEAKEALSSETEAVIPVALPTGFTTVRITRAELEEQIRPSIASTVHTLGQVLAVADVKNSDVDRILLVGGASRTPLVAEMLSSALGRPLALDAHPKHSVALGASRAAGAAATNDAGQLFAAVTSEIAVVAAPVAEATLEPISTTATKPANRRPLVLTLAAVAAALVLLVGALALRPDSKKQQASTGNTGSSSTRSTGSESSTPTSSSGADTTSVSTDSTGATIIVGPSGTVTPRSSAFSSSSTGTTGTTVQQVNAPGSVGALMVRVDSADETTYNVHLTWTAPTSGGAVARYRIRHTILGPPTPGCSGATVNYGGDEVDRFTTDEHLSIAATNVCGSWIRWEVAALNSANEGDPSNYFKVATGILPDIHGRELPYHLVRAVGGAATFAGKSDCGASTGQGCSTSPGAGGSVVSGQLVSVTEQS